MQKITVVYLSPVPDFKGGAERSLFDLLSNPRINPVLVVPEEGELAIRARSMNTPVEIIDFGAVHRVRRPFKLWHGARALTDAWFASRQLLTAVHRHNAAVIHTNGLKAHSIALFARLGGRAKLVMHFRDIAYTAQEKAVWKLLSKMASRAIFVSRACYPGERLPSNGRVIFNGIETKEPIAFSPSSPIRIGFIGRIHPHKGLHTLLEWIHFAKMSGKQIHLHIRGKFSSETLDYETQIKERIVELGLQSEVTFDGFLSDPGAVYRGIDVVCAPAQAAEPLARTILEPMSVGIPVIATDTGGTKEMVLDKVTGFIVNNAATFNEVMSILANDEAAILRMSEAGRHHIRNHFSKDKLHNSIHSLYSELLNDFDTQESRRG